nr:MAG TPA_asm: hypothetical protein [Caudoviricetes sp.]
MKTLNFISNDRSRSFGKPVIVDFNKNDVTQLNNITSYIDYIFVAPEDIEVRYKRGVKTHVLNANKGDIIISFYKDDYIENQVIVVKNKEWKANVASILAEEAANLARNQKIVSMCCDDCPCAKNCSRF